MRKALYTLAVLFAMIATGSGLIAQEITITLDSGWNWISYPNAEEMDIDAALGDFVPMEGDIIKSHFGNSQYSRGHWAGAVTRFVPGKGYKYYSSRTETTSFVFAHASSPFVTTAEPTDITAESAVVGGTFIIGEGNHLFACGVCWGMEEMPTLDGNHMSGEAIAGSQNFTLEGLTSGVTYYVRVYMVTDYGLAYGNQQSFTTEHEFVDLGLPSGTLWATCNVGAFVPEACGDYFAWGETEPKSSYSWSAYQYCHGSSTKLTKYCNNSSYGYNGFTDSLATLLPEDDAAKANWGDDWRVPTKEEWQELYNNTTSTWTTRNGVYGQLFTAANGNSLFLPAVGYRNNSSLSENGVAGDYLSSSLYTSIPNRAWEFNFGENNYGISSYGHRKLGLSVRAVRVSQNHAYVDLGLPSGTLWATCNVGANTPEEYGDNFAWGETAPKDIYDWNTYQYCDGDYDQLTKYCYISDYGNCGFTDNLTTLLPEDDAATANWGTDWRMPTDEEWNELLNNTTFTWTTQNGVSGGLFTASNGNSIFLPAAGFSLYWSSSLDWWSPDLALIFGFGPNGYDGEYWSEERSNGHSVRAVRSGPLVVNATANPEEGGVVIGGGIYQYTTNCTLVATANEGYVFANWTENGRVVSTEAEYSFTVYNHRNLVANFSLPLTITASVNPEGGGTVTGAGEYDYGTECMLIAVPNEGYTFVSWTENGAVVSTNASYSFIVTGDRELVANFALPFTIMVSINPEECGAVTGAGEYDYGTECMLTAVPNEGYTFVNWTENGIEVSSESSYSFTVTGDRNLEANFADFVDPNIHDYVDLGLPSGLLWATCNVGACAPEAYGDHFAWGETQPKSTYNWYTYQYCNVEDIWELGGETVFLTKYCTNSDFGDYYFEDDLTTLLPEDDAATANWGAGWRMPTSEEWSELLNNTTSTWTTQNGVNGRLFTASNGNSLFLPSAGNRWDDELYDAGYYGNYWSSSLGMTYWDLEESYNPYLAGYFNFNSVTCEMGNGERSYGFTVRPVREN